MLDPKGLAICIVIGIGLVATHVLAYEMGHKAGKTYGYMIVRTAIRRGALVVERGELRPAGRFQHWLDSTGIKWYS